MRAGGFVSDISAPVRRALDDLRRLITDNTDTITIITGPSSTVDHGALIGLGDNDHPQYSLTTHDHDADYDPLGSADAALLESDYRLVAALEISAGSVDAMFPTDSWGGFFEAGEPSSTTTTTLDGGDET